MTSRHRDGPEERLESRVQGESLEMPGLRLDFDQARRLWGLDADTCSRILDRLIARGFLSKDAHGRYARASEHPSAAPLRTAEAHIRRARKLKAR